MAALEGDGRDEADEEKGLTIRSDGLWREAMTFFHDMNTDEEDDEEEKEEEPEHDELPFWRSGLAPPLSGRPLRFPRRRQSRPQMAQALLTVDILHPPG